MSIDDIYRKIVPDASELWRDLMIAAELEALKLQALLSTPDPIFIRVSAEAFRLERDPFCVVVTRQPHGANYAQIKSMGRDGFPEKELGSLEFIQGSIWIKGQRLGPPQHGALFLIDLLAEYRCTGKQSQ